MYAPAASRVDHFEFLGSDAIDLAISRFLDTESLEDTNTFATAFSHLNGRSEYRGNAPVNAASPFPSAEPLRRSGYLTTAPHSLGALREHQAVAGFQSLYPASETVQPVSAQGAPSPQVFFVDDASNCVSVDIQGSDKNDPTVNGRPSDTVAVAPPIASTVHDVGARGDVPRDVETHGYLSTSPPASSGSRPSPCSENHKTVRIFESPCRKSQRRLTFRMDEHPTAPSLLLHPETALELSQRICGVDIASEDTPSLDGGWEESRMDLPLKERDVHDNKFEAMLAHELRLANDETDNLSRDIFTSSGFYDGQTTCVEHEETEFTPCKSEDFDLPKLVEWFRHVEKSYRQGVRLVKVSMTGKKLLRTVKVDDEFFSVSLSNGKFQSAHLCYMDTAKLGYASGEFMRLIEVTESGSEIPMVQVCGVVRMPSRSISLVFPSEEARNELIFLLRIKIRVAKYMYGDGSSVVLRANTKGTKLKHTNTIAMLKSDTLSSANTDV